MPNYDFKMAVMTRTALKLKEIECLETIDMFDFAMHVKKTNTDLSDKIKSNL